MKREIITVQLLLSLSIAYSQNIKLSHGLGEINHNLTYGDIIRTLGEPDSVYEYSPLNENPVPKNLPYYEMFYDKQNLVIHFTLDPFEKLTKRTNSPSIHLLNKSTIELNDVLPSEMDSTSIVKQYGPPKSISKGRNELVMDYDFRKRKYFSSLTFYFNLDGTINKIWIVCGKY